MALCRLLCQSSWARGAPCIISSLPSSRYQGLTTVATAAAATAAGAGAKAAAVPFKPSPLSYVLFLPSVVCGYLAYWQYERSMWKADLIRTREEMLLGEAKDIYSVQDCPDYLKVRASGRMLHERSIFVGPRPRSIPGYGIQSGFFLITPLFDPVRKGVVMVNRGWVPASWEDDIEKLASAHDTIPDPPSEQPAATSAPASSAAAPSSSSWFGWGARSKAPEAAIAQQQQVVTVVGVVQPSERPSAVLPDNEPSKFEFHWVDVPTLATTMGLPRDTPLVQMISDDPATQQQTKKLNPIQQARQEKQPSFGPSQYPIPKNTSDLVHFTTMPRDHNTYTFIWASLLVTLAFMARSAVFFPHKGYRMVGGHSNKALWSSVQPGIRGTDKA